MPESIFLPLLGGISALAGGLTSQTNTSNTSTPIYTSGQLGIQNQLKDAISTQLNNPTSLAPEQTAASGQVNNQYDAITKRMQAQFSGRGFGRSGSLVTNQQGVEMARAGAQGGLTDQFAQMQLNQNNQVAQEAQMFGFAGPGQQSNGTSGVNPLGAGLGAGMGTVSTLWMLNQMLTQNGNKGILN